MIARTERSENALSKFARGSSLDLEKTPTLHHSFARGCDILFPAGTLGEKISGWENTLPPSMEIPMRSRWTGICSRPFSALRPHSFQTGSVNPGGGRGRSRRMKASRGLFHCRSQRIKVPRLAIKAALASRSSPTPLERRRRARLFYY
jgi:hypothetical protein